MSSGLASDEVAEDYKNSLEDLTNNDRFQISNLTVIAKENTEHAMAISRVLENHIRTVGDTLSEYHRLGLVGPDETHNPSVVSLWDETSSNLLCRLRRLRSCPPCM